MTTGAEENLLISASFALSLAPLPNTRSSPPLAWPTALASSLASLWPLLLAIVHSSHNSWAAQWYIPLTTLHPFTFHLKWNLHMHELASPSHLSSFMLWHAPPGPVLSCYSGLSSVFKNIQGLSYVRRFIHAISSALFLILQSPAHTSLPLYPHFLNLNALFLSFMDLLTIEKYFYLFD